MRTGIFFLAAIATTLFSVISGQRSRHLTPEAKHVLHWYHLQARQLNKEADLLLDAVLQQDSEPEVQQQFLETRLAYKRLELLTAYFNPALTKRQAEGFRILEERLFPHIGEDDTADIRLATQKLITHILVLRQTTDSLQVTDAQLFDAMRLEIVRILTLGISGFDSPIAMESIREAEHALAGVKAVWLFYREELEERNIDLAERTLLLFSGARHMLDTTTDFSTFSRMDFIHDYLNPLAIQIKLAREALKIPYPDSTYFLDPAASHVFAKGAFNFSGTQLPMNSRFDQFMRGDAHQMDEAEIEGFNLFMGKAKCGTCHFAPLFNGNVSYVDKGEQFFETPAIRNLADTGITTHYSPQLTATEQEHIIAFVRTLNQAETIAGR